MDQLVNALFTTKHRALHRVIDCRPDKGELNHVYLAVCSTPSG